MWHYRRWNPLCSVWRKIPPFPFHCYNGKNEIKQLQFSTNKQKILFIYSLNDSVCSQASADAGNKLACFTLFVGKSLRAKYVGWGTVVARGSVTRLTPEGHECRSAGAVGWVFLKGDLGDLLKKYWCNRNSFLPIKIILIFRTVVPKMYSAAPSGFQGIREYVSVMANLKFTYFYKLLE